MPAMRGALAPPAPAAHDRPAAAMTTVSRAVSGDAATRAFSISMLLSAARCLLSYVLLPWVLPAVGVAAGVGPGIGIVVGAAAVASNLASIRRFQRSAYRWRRHVTALNVVVAVLVSFLLVRDVVALLS